MRILLKIQRFNPKLEDLPYFEEFLVEVEPTDRILDALMIVKNRMDPTLGIRRSCAHGVCGSDAMVINGKERLACKTLVGDVADHDGTVVIIEPLKTLPVERDLMVAQDKFFENYRRVKPYLINDDKPEEKEWLQTPEERKPMDDATKCILCAACFSACPVIRETDPEFLGPAAIVQASRFLDDSRDRGFEERLPELDRTNGVWPCLTHFECTRVCPRRIPVTKRINQTKARIKKHHEDRGGTES